MRTATILYQPGTGGDPVAAPEGSIAAAGLDPTWTEWAGGGPGALNDALLRLATRGAGRVVAVAARLTADGTLDLGSTRMRLLG